jgi:hypothetical protein
MHFIVERKKDRQADTFLLGDKRLYFVSVSLFFPEESALLLVEKAYYTGAIFTTIPLVK